jgi:hypothetical protein
MRSTLLSLLFSLVTYSITFAQPQYKLPIGVAKTAEFLQKSFNKQKTILDCHWSGNTYFCTKWFPGGTKAAKAIVDKSIGVFATGNWAGMEWFGGKIWNRSFELPSGAGVQAMLSKPDAEARVNIQFNLYTAPN